MIKERNLLPFPDTFKVSCLIKSPKQYNISDLIKVIGNKILGYDEANIIVRYNDKLLNRFSTSDCELQALLDKTIVPHTYNLLLRTNHQDSLASIICHEMKHFDQYEKGELEIKKEPSGLVFNYKGEEYPSNIAYSDRPWEKEAKRSQYALWKEFKKIYYKTK